MMIRTVIIDDEINGRKIVRGIVETQPERFIVAGEGFDIKSGLQVIKLQKPDLVLLDINLPDGTAFDLLEQIGHVDFKIIFITAHSDYAVQAFKFSAVDYILKPIISTELYRALDKVEQSMSIEDLNVKMSSLLANLNPVNKTKKLVLKSIDSILSVDISEIYYCESDGGSYTRFYLDNDQVFLVSRPLKEYDDLLTNHNFFRVHKSYLVNLNKVSRYVKQDGGTVIINNRFEIPVSHRKREEFLERFMAL
ncbi:MAG TPA: LytTR family DNA-binding domain-containing protein [Bacteroidales bacterium]|nr:LytTR family DNA-binding domain-containing protein [Bacteroidales bacterium]